MFKKTALFLWDGFPKMHLYFNLFLAILIFSIEELIEKGILVVQALIEGGLINVDGGVWQHLHNTYIWPPDGTSCIREA